MPEEVVTAPVSRAASCDSEDCDRDELDEDLAEADYLIGRAYRFLTEGGSDFERLCLIGDLRERAQ